ncbi:MAG: phosphatidate cytidylyltransferase [Anaerolineales bacterium]|nr:phosphatidate cytidylyltransferase [Anaerolineales bacterium]
MVYRPSSIFFRSLPLNNYIALALTFVLSLVFLRSMDFIAHRGWMDSKLSRKVIHIGTGPLFVLCWFLFNDAPSARWLAALVPFAITVQFALIGFGVLKDKASVEAMSRTGDPKEILRGPLYYGIMFVVLTVVYWKDSPIGIIALMMMCGGDGIADIFGRRIPSPKLPWSKEKSVAGMVSVFVGGFVMSALMLFIYVSAGVFAAPFTRYLLPIAAIALVGALVESLHYKDIDNISMTLASALLGHWFF